MDFVFSFLDIKVHLKAVPCCYCTQSEFQITISFQILVRSLATFLCTQGKVGEWNTITTPTTTTIRVQLGNSIKEATLICFYYVLPTKPLQLQTVNTKVLGLEFTSITLEKGLHFGDYCSNDAIFAILLVLREIFVARLIVILDNLHTGLDMI